MMNKYSWPLLSVLIFHIVILEPDLSLSQEITRETRWNEDLGYLIERLEITHPNLYGNISKESFLGYTDQLQQRIPAATDVEMVFGIQELVARIRNGHTLCKPILAMSDPGELREQFQYYPVMYYPFDDGLYVMAVAEQYEIVLGKKVVRIGNMTVDEAMGELARFAAADNAMATLEYVRRFCLNDGQLLNHIGASNSPEKIMLTLEDNDGNILESEIETDPNYGKSAISWLSMAGGTNPVPLYLKNQRDSYWFEYIAEQEAIYLQINALYDNESETFGDFCSRMFDTLDERESQKLIVDIRSCPGGDHIELPLLKGILARPHIDRSDRLFLIIGRKTGSAAQHLTSVFESYTNATLFGKETGSKPNQYGAMQHFSLPHSRLEISCALKFFQDARPSDFSLSSTPDIFVPLSSSDFAEMRDPVMQRIADYDSYKDMKPEFKRLMSEAYTDGGIARFKEVYAALKDKYAEHGFNMEVLLFDELDHWMGDNRKSDNDYIEYLKFIHGELPNSIAICYDLAWWLNDSGDPAGAKRLYEKCIELNPEHHHARWRLGLIELEERWQSEN